MSEVEIKKAWQSQPAALPQLAPADLRVEAAALQRKVARRNLGEYLGGAIVIPCFAFYLWYFPDWVIRLGAALVILGTLFVMWQVHRRAGARVLPEDFGADGLRFQRRELSRQRDALRGVWFWYIGPLLPGLLVFMCGVQGGSPRRLALFVDLMMLAVLGFIAWINRRGAALLQRRIDMLDALAGSPDDA